jgi:hypothetical protein
MKKTVPDDLIDPSGTSDPAGLVRLYLKRTDHGRRFLAKKSAIGLYPALIFGQTVWAARRLARHIENAFQQTVAASGLPVSHC